MIARNGEFRFYRTESGEVVAADSAGWLPQSWATLAAAIDELT